jgi:hypothetical protein
MHRTAWNFPCSDHRIRDPSSGTRHREYGSTADLQGITKIYVNTGEDLDTRDNIVRIILRELPMLTVTARSRPK